MSGGNSNQTGNCTLILTHKRPCSTIERGRNRSYNKIKEKIKKSFSLHCKRKGLRDPCPILPIGITPFSYATNLIKVTSISCFSQDKVKRFCCSLVPTSQHMLRFVSAVHSLCKLQVVLPPLPHLIQILLGDIVLLMSVHCSPH